MFSITLLVSFPGRHLYAHCRDGPSRSLPAALEPFRELALASPPTVASGPPIEIVDAAPFTYFISGDDR